MYLLIYKIGALMSKEALRHIRHCYECHNCVDINSFHCKVSNSHLRM